MAIDPQRQQLIGLRTARGDPGPGGRELADGGQGGGRRDQRPPREHQGGRLRGHGLRRLRGQAGPARASRSSPSTARTCSPCSRSTCSRCAPARRSPGAAWRPAPATTWSSRRGSGSRLWDVPEAEVRAARADRQADQEPHHLLAHERGGDQEGHRHGAPAQRGRHALRDHRPVAGSGCSPTPTRPTSAASAGHAGHALPAGLPGQGRSPGRSSSSTPCSTRRPAPPRCGSSSPTPRGELKPEMFGEVTLRTAGARGPAHPRRRGHRLGHQEGGLRGARRGQVPAARGRGRPE